jgi:FHA domain
MMKRKNGCRQVYMKCPNCNNKIEENDIKKEVLKCCKCSKIIGCVCCLVPGTPEYQHCHEHVQAEGYKRPGLITYDNKVFMLSKVHTIIGRDIKNDIVCNDRYLSRNHAQIALDPRSNRWIIRDLNSTNGTFVNGKKIGEAILMDNDYVKMGGIVFIFKSMKEVKDGKSF